MQAVHPVQQYDRSQHGILFNVVAYTCGGVYALGQITLQGLGNVLSAAGNIAWQTGADGICGLQEIVKGIQWVAHEIFCMAQLIGVFVAPFFKEELHYAYRGLVEVWKVLRDLPDDIITLIEIPGSILGRFVKELASNVYSGGYQIYLSICLIIETIREIRDFGTLGAIVKENVQLLGAGIFEIFKAMLFLWEETNLPREIGLRILVELAENTLSGFKEIGKGLSELYQRTKDLFKIPIEITWRLICEEAETIYFGLYQIYLSAFFIKEEVSPALEISYILFKMILREIVDQLISGVSELVKAYEFTKEDLGNSLQDFVIDPIAPYAKEVYDQIWRVIAEIEKAVNEIQKLIFG